MGMNPGCGHGTPLPLSTMLDWQHAITEGEKSVPATGHLHSPCKSTLPDPASVRTYARMYLHRSFHGSSCGQLLSTTLLRPASASATCSNILGLLQLRILLRPHSSLRNLQSIATCAVRGCGFIQHCEQVLDAASLQQQGHASQYKSQIDVAR